VDTGGLNLPVVSLEDLLNQAKLNLKDIEDGKRI
jgi:hypothetical protein